MAPALSSTERDLRKPGPSRVRRHGSFVTTRSTHMNKDQIKGTLKKLEGEVQQSAGEVIGSRSQQAKGLKKQIDGRARKAVGDIKEIVRDATSK
jgi:uncharacterized protein YjbJ (UPF0337 family)